LGVHFYGKVKKMLQALKMDAPHLNDTKDHYLSFVFPATRSPSLVIPAN
jgi:hypothetical protein